MTRAALFACVLIAGVPAAGRADTTPPGLPEALPEGAIVRLGSSRFVHASYVSALSVSPDSSLIVTGTQDGFIYLWDVATAKERAKWRHSNTNITSLQFSPDGKMLASSCSQGVLHVWSLDGRQIFSRPTTRYEPVHFAWLPRGNRLVFSGQSGTISVWDVVASREERSWQTKFTNISGLACSPDGKQLVARDAAGKLKSFDVASGQDIVTYEGTLGPARSYRETQLLAFTPDGKTLVSDTQRTGVALYDPATGKLKRRLDSVNSVHSSSLSGNGRFLATASGSGGLRIVGLASGLELRTLEPVPYFTNLVAFAPNDRWLVAVVGGQSLRVWDLSSSEELHKSTGHAGPISALVFLNDDRLVSSAADRTLRCWDARGGKEVDRHKHSEYFNQMIPAPDGKGVLLPQTYFLFQWQPGGRSDYTPLSSMPSGGAQVLLAPDARAILAYRGGQHLTVYELPGAKELRRIQTANIYLQALALSPGARYLAYIESNNYGTVHIRDLVHGHAKRPIVGNPGQNLYAERMLFSPDGRLLVSVATSRPTYIWEAFTGLLRAAIPRMENSGACSACFSPGSRYLALGCHNGAVYVHDLRHAQTAGPFLGHKAPITSLAFSADGSLLATGSLDTTAVVWEVARLIAKLPAQPATAPTAVQFNTWWAGLASVDGRAAGDAVWSLSSHPKETLELFRDKLKPVIGPEKGAVERWVVELGDPKFAVREQAQRNLAAMGDGARPALNAGLQTMKSAEARARIARLLEVINSYFAPARLQPLRALEVLEKIGSREAREQVEALARRSTDEEIRQEIERVLRRWK